MRTLQLYTTADLAEMFGISVFTIRAWIREGKIPAGRTIGRGRYVFTESQVDTIRDCLESGVSLGEDEVA